MQPKTRVHFDKSTFNNMKKTLRNVSLARKAQLQNPTSALASPGDIGIKLNNGCNLRCTHCFEWNSDGYHHGMSKNKKKQEIDFSMLENILEQTKEHKSRLYLWGGEPLLYSNFDQLADLLVRDPRTTTLCTNGMLIDQKLEAILKMSEDLTLLISLEGFEFENDKIRGKGTFRKAMDAIELLLSLQRQGRYKGRISISLTIHDDMITKLYKFMEYFEELGVDTVYFVFPWYIPPHIADDMDQYYESQFSWLSSQWDQHKYSWHSFTFHVAESNIEPLMKEVERMSQRIWNIRIRLQPALELHEIREFILGSEKPAMNRTKCLSISNRLDIMPDGSVNPCKFFPEFTLGDLNETDIHHVFHSSNFEKHREVLGCGLMPICSRCVLLYNYGS